MTRQEFSHNVMFWADLIDVCQEYGCDLCDDIFYGDTMDDCLHESIIDELSYRTWHDVKELLEDIEWGGDDAYYMRNDEWDWHYLNDTDFYTLKDEVEEWMNANGCFDIGEEDEDDEELEDIEEHEFPEYPVHKPVEVEELEIEPEPIGIAELFTVSNSQLQSLIWKQE